MKKIERTAPSPAELAGLYTDAGWIDEPAEDRMAIAIENTSEWFVARDSNGALQGIGRMITDYSRYAFVVDVIVSKPLQGAGIGTKIMEEILSEWRKLDIDNIDLWPAPGKFSFYERFGFVALPVDQPHMKLRKQS